MSADPVNHLSDLIMSNPALSPADRGIDAHLLLVEQAFQNRNITQARQFLRDAMDCVAEIADELERNRLLAKLNPLHQRLFDEDRQNAPIVIESLVIKIANAIAHKDFYQAESDIGNATSLLLKLENNEQNNKFYGRLRDLSKEINTQKNYAAIPTLLTSAENAISKENFTAAARCINQAAALLVSKDEDPNEHRKALSMLALKVIEPLSVEISNWVAVDIDSFKASYNTAKELCLLIDDSEQKQKYESALEITQSSLENKVKSIENAIKNEHFDTAQILLEFMNFLLELAGEHQKKYYTPILTGFLPQISKGRKGKAISDEIAKIEGIINEHEALKIDPDDIATMLKTVEFMNSSLLDKKEREDFKSHLSNLQQKVTLMQEEKKLHQRINAIKNLFKKFDQLLPVLQDNVEDFVHLTRAAPVLIQVKSLLSAVEDQKQDPELKDQLIGRIHSLTGIIIQKADQIKDSSARNRTDIDSVICCINEVLKELTPEVGRRETHTLEHLKSALSDIKETQFGNPEPDNNNSSFFVGIGFLSGFSRGSSRADSSSSNSPETPPKSFFSLNNG